MKTYLWILALPLLLTSCSKFGFVGVESTERASTETQFRKTLAGQLLPTKLEVVSDSDSIPAGSCKGFTVNSRAQNGLLSGVNFDLSFSVTADHTGKFYEDANCTVENSQLVILKGFHARRFYFKSGPLKSGIDSLRISASTKAFQNVSGTPTTYVSKTLSIINSKPSLENADYTVDEDGTLTVQLVAKDDNGDSLTFIPLTSPTRAASVTLNTAGRLTYVPIANYNGPDSFQYYVTDGRATSDVKTVRIGVKAVNDPPTLPAAINLAPTDERQSDSAPGVLFDLKSYAFDVDLDPNLNLDNSYEEELSFSVIDNPDRGNQTLSGSNLNYKSTKNSNKPDSLVVRVTDRAGESATTQVNYTIRALNDAPVVSNTSLTLVETNSPVVAALDLAALVFDIDTDPNLNLNPQAAPTLSIIQSPARGTYNLPGKQYTAFTDYSGSDTIVFRASDGSAFANGTVSINIAPTNDIPTAEDVVVEITEDMSRLISLGSDVDLDTTKNQNITDALTIVVTSNPTKGSYNPITKIYTPLLNLTGSDSFKYLVRDSANQTSAEKTVTLNILNTNDRPTLTRVDAKTGALEDTDFALTLNLSNTDLSDPDPGSTLFFRVEYIQPGSSLKRSGSLLSVGSLFSPGDVLTWRAPANTSGSAIRAFSVVGYDGSLASTDDKDVLIDVSPINDPPVPVSKSVEVLTSAQAIFNLEAGDVDSSAFTYTVTGLNVVSGNGSNPGTQSLSGSQVTYTPVPGFEGMVSLTFRVRDNGSLGTAPVDSTTDGIITLVVGDSLEVVRSGPLCNPTGTEIINTILLYSRVVGVSNVDNQIYYTLVSIPTQGTLLFNGVPAAIGQTFTQLDLNQNKLRFQTSPTGGITSFQYTVDYLNDGIDVLGPESFEIRPGGGGTCP